MFNTAKQISSNVGWGSPQQRQFTAGVHRRLGFTPAGINPSLRLQKNSVLSNVGWGLPQRTKQKISVQKIIAISAFSTLAITSHAQTCNDNIPKTAPDSRYEILGNGSEVKDTQTGLIWQRCSLGQTWDGNSCTGTAKGYNWQQALSQASALGNGYRLPNIKELQTLVEEACYDPAINSTIFPNTQSRGYWSASPLANNSDYARGVGFFYGNTYYSLKNSYYPVRAVRSMSEE